MDFIDSVGGLAVVSSDVSLEPGEGILVRANLSAVSFLKDLPVISRIIGILEGSGVGAASVSDVSLRLDGACIEGLCLKNLSDSAEGVGKVVEGLSARRISLDSAGGVSVSDLSSDMSLSLSGSVSGGAEAAGGVGVDASVLLSAGEVRFGGESGPAVGDMASYVNLSVSPENDGERRVDVEVKQFESVFSGIPAMDSVAAVFNRAKVENLFVVLDSGGESPGRSARVSFDALELGHDSAPGVVLGNAVFTVSMGAGEVKTCQFCGAKLKVPMGAGEDAGAMSFSGLYIDSLELSLMQSVAAKVIPLIAGELEQRGVYNLKLIFSGKRNRIILSGEYRGVMFPIPFSVEFAVEAKKNLVKVVISDIRLSQFSVPEIVVQKIIMAAIEKSLSFDFIRVKENYVLLSLRKLVPDFIDYNPIDVRVKKGRLVLRISEQVAVAAAAPEELAPTEAASSSEVPAESGPAERPAEEGEI